MGAGSLRGYHVNFGSTGVDIDFSEFADQTAADAVFVPNGSQIVVNVSTDVLTTNFRRTGVNDLCYFDLQNSTYGFGENLSDTAWIARIKWHVTAYTNTNVQGCIGFSDNTSDYNTAQDGLYLETVDNGANGFRGNAPNGAAPDVSGLSAMTTDMATTIWYIQLIRLSATSFTIEFYSDNGFSSLIESKNYTVSSGIVNLRYFKVFNNNSGSATGTITSTIDELQIKNGVTTW